MNLASCKTISTERVDTCQELLQPLYTDVSILAQLVFAAAAKLGKEPKLLERHKLVDVIRGKPEALTFEEARPVLRFLMRGTCNFLKRVC